MLEGEFFSVWKIVPAKLEKHTFHSYVRRLDLNAKSVIEENLCFDVKAVQ